MHPTPFFVDAERRSGVEEAMTWNITKIEVSRERLMEAIAEVEELADWMRANDEAVWAWRDRGKARP